MENVKELTVNDLTPGITCSGARCTVYFDPENFEVYEFSNVGSGWPMLAHHGRHLELGSLPVELATDEPYREFLEASAATLAEIAATITVEWDGSNHVGRLTEEGREKLNSIREDWDAIEPPTYWDAGEWFAPVRSDVASELVGDAGVEGFDEWVQTQVSYGAGEGAHLNSNDVRIAARDILADFIDAHEDDEEEAHAVATARAILEATA